MATINANKFLRPPLFLLLYLLCPFRYTLGFVPYSVHVIPKARPIRFQTFKTALSNVKECLIFREEEPWETGDVYADLERLEIAINYTTAEQNLQAAERVHLLDHLAKSRRPLFADVKKYMLNPLVLAFLLHIFHSSPKCRPFVQGVHMFVDFHFLTVVVFAPMLLLCAKATTLRSAEALPQQLRGLDLEDISFLDIDWKKQASSCRDNVLFLLEYWTSSTAGMGILILGKSLLHRNPPNGFNFIYNLSQCITRIGTIASLYQFPKMLFQFQRDGKKLPQSLVPTIMQYIITSMLVWAPFGIASDISKLLSFMGHDSIIAFYISICLLTGAAWQKVLQKQNRPSDLKKARNYRYFSSALVKALALAAIWRKPCANLDIHFQSILFAKITGKQVEAAIAFVLNTLLAISYAAIPMLSSFIHIIAVKKLFKVVHTHDLSLSTDAKSFKQAIENEAEMNHRMKWRYCLEWREEKRFGRLLKDWKKNLGYWLFVRGTVTEKLAMEERAARKRDAMKERGILKRISDDIQNTPEGTLTPNRDQWKAYAMKQIAEKHLKDFSNKNYQDPLGVAVHQTFGIGLGFNFDHMKKLKPNELVTIRRLQARAAKSAIRRVQELYAAESSSLEQIKNLDASDRLEREAAIRQATANEVNYLRNRLVELVPVGPSREFTDSCRFQQFQQKTYKKKSAHEYIMENKGINSSGLNRGATIQGKEKSVGDEEVDPFIVA